MIGLINKDDMYPQSIVAVTAVLMIQEDIDRLAKVLEDRLGKKVELINEVDKKVIAGVLLKSEGKIFDGTFRGELKSMKRTLMDAQLRETEV